MISVSKTPAVPAGTSANAAVAPGTPETPASPFDVILSLESLAATCTALDPGSLDGALEGVEESLTDGDDRDPDESDGEAEGPLAFLASLLNMANVPAQAQSTAGSGGDDAIEDASGGGKSAATSAPDAGAIAPSTQQGAVTAGGGANALAAAQLLAGDPAAAADTGTKPADTTQSPDASTASLARAAEMLSQGARHAAAPRDTIPTPVHSPRWAEDFSARVAMMVRGAESSASLQLTPVDLGPVDVSVTVRDSQATIHFGAAQADTRALLEASIPRLREMLAAQGFNLMDASVSQGFTRQARPDVPAAPRLGAEPEAEVQATTHVTAPGLLDTYA